jgi:cell division protein FtsL
VSTPAKRLNIPPSSTRIATPPPATRARRPDPRSTTPAPAATTRRRRRHHLGFALLAGVLIGSMLFGIVVLNALLAQTSFRIDQAERRIEELSQEHLALEREQATLSAPGRIAAWASRHGMRLPDDIRILHAPGVGSADPAGAGTSSPSVAGGPGA